MKQIISLLLILPFTGCSFFVPRHQTLNVMVSEPPRAKVWVNGNYEGESPVSVSVPRNRTTAIIVKADGYESSQRMIQYGFSTTGTLDLVFGCIILVPLLGLTAPGAQSLDDTSLIFKLHPEKQP